MPSSNDPRSYVKSFPVPTVDDRGRRVQARALGSSTSSPHPTIYSADTQTRQQVRQTDSLHRKPLHFEKKLVEADRPFMSHPAVVAGKDRPPPPTPPTRPAAKNSP